MKELRQTVETLWDSTKGTRNPIMAAICIVYSIYSSAEFIHENPQYVAQRNAMNFLSDDRGEEYNLCHCASPFLPL